MAIKTKVIGVIAGLVGLVSVGTGVLAAQTATNGPGPNGFMADIASAIAQKFNLNASDVQSVIDGQMEQHQAQMQEQRQLSFESRLAQAVANGKLTQAQADAIKAQKASVQAQIEALKDKTPEERQAVMKLIMEAQKQWAKDNNIPQGYMLFGFGGVGMHKGEGMGRGMGPGNPHWQDDDSD